jgi:hypothetical protein
MKILLRFLLTIVCVIVPVLGQEDCLAESERVDCYLVEVPSQLGCQAKGCLWCPADDGPSCYLPPKYGYRIEGTPQVEPEGFTVNLRRATNITYYGHDSPLITVKGEFQSDYRLRIKVR